MLILKDFIFALFREWKVWLTDSIVMVIIAMALLVKPELAPLPLWLWILIVFGAGLLVASFKAFKAARTAQLTAEDASRPKIKVSFGEHVAGCVVSTTVGTRKTPAKWIRLKIEADSVGEVSDCSVTLVGLSRNNVTIFDNESIALNMARSDPPGDKKHVRDGVPEYADIVGITAFNRVFITPPTHGTGLPNSLGDHDKIFSGSGDYVFNLVASAPTTRSVKCSVIMHWAGDWKTVSFHPL